MGSTLPLKTSAKFRNLRIPNVLKVIDYLQFIEEGTFGPEYCLLYEANHTNVDEILALGWGAVVYPGRETPSGESAHPAVFGLGNPDIVAAGDIISVSESGLYILFRKRSNSNMLFVTEQCNHQCIMCSQPPRNIDDSWRVNECLAIVDLMDDENGQVLGISGGEPSLLGEGLIDIIRHCKESIPKTHLHILTNGAAFSDREKVERITSVGHEKLIWGVPIFGSTPQQHDYHTQVSGSFDRTIHGLYNLALFNQAIELRVVLTLNILENIEVLSEFILRNLPFAQSVALMGLEPTGYARKNYQEVWCEIEDFSESIGRAASHLQACSVNVQLYNIPLCKLPAELHYIAVQSISDWKNLYLEECKVCSKQGQCCGFFQSVNAKFVNNRVIPFSTSDLGEIIDATSNS